MRTLLIGLCAVLLAGGLSAGQTATPLDPQAVLQEMSTRMLAADSFHQAGQMSATITMGEIGQNPLIFPLETWYEKPDKLALRWANTLMIFDGTYGYFYAAGSPVAYRFPSSGLPPGWEQWLVQPMTGAETVAPSYYPPEIMRWLAESASAYAIGDEVHIVFNLSGEQLMQIMGQTGYPVPGLEGGEAAGGMMQAFSQILGMMETTWDVALDAYTYLTRYIRGQIGMPNLGVSTDFLLQFPVSEQNIAVPPEVFVFSVPEGVRVLDSVPPWLSFGTAPEEAAPPEEIAPPEETMPPEETAPEGEY